LVYILGSKRIYQSERSVSGCRLHPVNTKRNYDCYDIQLKKIDF